MEALVISDSLDFSILRSAKIAFEYVPKTLIADASEESQRELGRRSRGICRRWRPVAALLYGPQPCAFRDFLCWPCAAHLP